MKRNCDGDEEKLAGNFNEWFEKRLWKNGAIWFDDVLKRFRVTFHDADFAAVIARLPASPPIQHLNVAPGTGGLVLANQLAIAIAPIALWVDKMTKIMRELQTLGTPKCSIDVDLLDYMQDIRDELVLKVVPANTNVPRQVCRAYTHWGRTFRDWGGGMHDWHAAFNNCLPVGPGGGRDGVTPPPWPPWGAYDGTYPDFIPPPPGTTQLATKEVEEFAVALLQQTQVITSKNANTGLFPHGLTQIELKLSVAGAMDIEIKLLGPDSGSGNTAAGNNVNGSDSDE